MLVVRSIQLNSMSFTVFGMLLFEALLTIVSAKAADESAPLVHTSSGSLTGVALRSGEKIVDAYLGIPFAEPPTGERRFQMPLPVTSWKGTLRAVNMSKGCVQTDFAILNDVKLNMSDTTEDCLYLNVWVPRRSCHESGGNCLQGMPVFVFLYGGLFNWGSSSLPFYDGLELAARAEVIYVSFNYRLGIFGFLNASSPAAPGNMGLYDQVEALRWINKNIKFFGGDPNSVTLSGQSAGAVSVSYHMISQLSKGLFKRAVLFSGTPHTLAYSHNTDHHVNFRIVSEALSCVNRSTPIDAQVPDVVDCLRKLDAHELASRAAKALSFRIATVLPGYGDAFLPNSPIDVDNSVPHIKEVLLGTTEDDGAFLVYQILSRIPMVRDQLDGPTALRIPLRSLLHIDSATSAKIAQSYFKDSVHDEPWEVQKNFSNAITDAGFECSTTLFASSLCALNATVFRFSFDHRPSYSFWPDWLTATHADELRFFLGTFQSVEKIKTRVYGASAEKVRKPIHPTANELQFSDDLMNTLSTFCHTG